jgi:hypothetical protein
VNRTEDRWPDRRSSELPRKLEAAGGAAQGGRRALTLEHVLGIARRSGLSLHPPGERISGIYEMQGRKLKLMLLPPGDKRPRDFKVKEDGDSAFVLLFEQAGK